MNKLDKFIFKIIEKNENKKNENENKKDLSQPNLSPTDKKNNNKRIIRKVIIAVSIISVIGLIIFLAVWFNRDVGIRLDPYKIKDISVQKTTANKKEMQISIEGRNQPYIVDITNPNTSLLSVYYVTTEQNVQFRMLTVDGREIVFRVHVTYGLPETTNQYTIGRLSFVKNPNNNESQNEVYSFFDVAVSNLVVAPPKPFDWLGLILSLLPILLIFLLFYLSYRSMKGQLGALGSDGKIANKVLKSNVSFKDVAGIEEVKDELSEIVDFLKKPKKYFELGARIPRGVILYGPPGTGKTLIAKAVAGEASVPFFQASGSSFDDMFVGSGAKRVRELFVKARKEAPSIIFIDEIDSVASKRGQKSMTSSGLLDQTINQLLAEMDGFNTSEGVIVIAATNRLDVLDDAILRPGRFDRQIQVSLPDIKGREEILKIHAKNKNLSKSVSLLDVARRTAGFSGAQLEDVLNEAVLLTVRRSKVAITIHEIDEAIDRVIGGPARKGRVISDHEKKQIAYHEAGHALIGLHLDASEVVEKITIIPRGSAAGYTMQTPQEQERLIPRKIDMLNLVTMTLGGRAAEEIIYGPEQISAGASNDLYKVTRIVKSMVTQLGMTDIGLVQYYPSEGVSNEFKNDFSEQTAILIDKKINDIVNECYEKAKDIIQKNKKELDLIVETLLILETIIRPEIDYIHKNLKLPESAIKRKEELIKEQKEQKDKSEDKESENQNQSIDQKN